MYPSKINKLFESSTRIYINAVLGVKGLVNKRSKHRCGFQGPSVFAYFLNSTLVNKGVYTFGFNMEVQNPGVQNYWAKLNLVN